MLMACFNFLLPSAKKMRTWQGKCTSTGERNSDKSGPMSKIPLQEQLFMVMVRLQLGFNVEDLADRFYVFLNHQLNLYNMDQFDVRQIQGVANLDVSIKSRQMNAILLQKWYPSTRVIIDAIKFFIQK